MEATAADLPALETVAEEAFVTGRFRLDWRLASTLNGLRYRHWVRTSLDNPRHLVLKGIAERRLAGFFIIERTATDRCYWHLTAVAPAVQGQGMGKRLWRSVMRHLQSQGVDVIETLISLHNTPVLNLYARLGFSFTPPEMTFHWLRGERLESLGLQV
jgi:ribosomal protein S18 acetylase RimI-like enzyme